MANEDELIQSLKEKGLTCNKLKSIESRERKESGEFRRIGFNEIASVQEASANKIRELRTKVCKLRWPLCLIINCGRF